MTHLPTPPLQPGAAASFWRDLADALPVPSAPAAAAVFQEQLGRVRAAAAMAEAAEDDALSSEDMAVRYNGVKAALAAADRTKAAYLLAKGISNGNHAGRRAVARNGRRADTPQAAWRRYDLK